MAGLLTRGSQLSRTFPGAHAQWFYRGALRSQLRGQSRIWRLLATPHRVPIFVSWPWAVENHHGRSNGLDMAASRNKDGAHFFCLEPGLRIGWAKGRKSAYGSYWFGPQFGLTNLHAMIRAAGQYGRCAVKLFAQHYTGQHVGPDHLTER